MEEENVNLAEHRHRESDKLPVHITREIPLPWLIGGAFAIVVQAVTLYLGQQQQAETLRQLAADVKEVRTRAESGGLKIIEYGLQLQDHERRLQAAETKAAAKP